MILSRRERNIAILALGVLGVLIFDWFVLGPLLSRREELRSRMQLLQDKDLAPAQRLISNKRRMDAKWKEMAAAGLKTDASAAESQVLNAVQVWAQETGLNLSSLKPERNEQERQFQKITIRATGVGPMTAVSRFLGRIQKSPLPLRISDMQISSRKEGTDDLSLQIGISTLYLAPETEKSSKGAFVAGAREDKP